MGEKVKPSPVDTHLLYRAEWILKNRGLQDFLDFAEVEGFTANDIEAVQNKVNGVFKLSDLKKLLSKIGNKTNKEQIEDEVPF